MMRNKVKGNKNVANLAGVAGGGGGLFMEVYADQGVQTYVEMVDAEVNNFRLSYNKTQQKGASAFNLKEADTDTLDLVEFEDAAVGKDAKPGAKNLGESAGQEQAETAIGTHVNTI